MTAAPATKRPPPGRLTPNAEAKLREAGANRRRLEAEFTAADQHWRKLIRAAFNRNVSGPQIADAAGISIPRIYQIRDGRRR